MYIYLFIFFYILINPLRDFIGYSIPSCPTKKQLVSISTLDPGLSHVSGAATFSKQRNLFSEKSHGQFSEAFAFGCRPKGPCHCKITWNLHLHDM